MKVSIAGVVSVELDHPVSRGTRKSSGKHLAHFLHGQRLQFKDSKTILVISPRVPGEGAGFTQNRCPQCLADVAGTQVTAPPFCCSTPTPTRYLRFARTSRFRQRKVTGCHEEFRHRLRLA